MFGLIAVGVCSGIAGLIFGFLLGAFVTDLIRNLE